MELANLVQTTVVAFIIPLMETESDFSIIFEFSQELMNNPVFVVMRVGDESIEHKALLPEFSFHRFARSNQVHPVPASEK